MRQVIAVLAVVAAMGLSACDKTEYVEQSDAGSQQDTGIQEDAPACGPDTYPCPPYGTTRGDVLEDLTFTGWMDDNADGDLLNDPYRTWGLDYFYQLGLAGEAKFLMLNASAGWCSVCRTETRTLGKLEADYKAQGFRLAQILFEDNDALPANRTFVETWIASFDVPFPVGVDASFKTGRYFDVAATPANFIIALKDMTINGTPVKAMQLLYLMTGYAETEMRALFDELAANSQ